MAAACTKFQGLANSLALGAMDLASDVLKLMLVSSIPSVASSLYSDVSATEVAAGNGYVTGGAQAVQSGSGQVGGKYTLTLSNVVFTAQGVLGPFRYLVLYSTNVSVLNKPLIGFWDYGSVLTMLESQSLTIGFDATNGVLQIQ